MKYCGQGHLTSKQSVFVWIFRHKTQFILFVNTSVYKKYYAPQAKCIYIQIGEKKVLTLKVENTIQVKIFIGRRLTTYVSKIVVLKTI